MITTFDNEKHFWIVRRFLSKASVLIICSIIVFASPVFERSIYLTIFLLGLGIIAFVSEFIKKYETDIFSLTFNDEKRHLLVVSFKYGFKRRETLIPYDKLWYVKVPIKSDYFTGKFSGFNVQMRESRDLPANIDFFYIQSAISGAFSEKKFYTILDKLTEVGSELF